MRTILTTTLLLIVILNSSAQNVSTYLDEKENKHLCGPFEISALEKDTSYQSWFHENYNDYEVDIIEDSWKESLKSMEVDIYIGTWCGDSKTWLPRFIKLWDELGLDRNQLNLIALYNGDEKYKQGPNGEEKGKRIHRVPTFIFKEKGEEQARIVEFPATSLETDLAQIALGYPSMPNYKAANYLLSTLEKVTIDTIYSNYRYFVNSVYRKVAKSSELNTLGYVLLRSNRLKEAALVFHMNTLCFSTNPNVYDSYGESLALLGDKENAIKQYKKVLALKPDHENAIEQLKLLEATE